MVKYAVGLDVSSQKINACMVSIDAIQQFKVVATTVIQNNLKGFSTLDAWVKKHQKQKEISLSFCIEATGIYHENCALFFTQKPLRCFYCFAQQVKKIHTKLRI
jgi:transposase